MTTRRSALAAAHGAALLFGLTGIFGALIHASAAMITGGRAAFAVAALALFALLRGRALLYGLERRRAAILALSGLLLAVHWVTFFVAVQVGGVAVATLGFASFPAFIALLDLALFRDRPGLWEGVLLGLVTLGLALVTPSFEMGNSGTLGLLWGVASGLSFAILAVLNRRTLRGIDPLQVAFWQNLVVALVLAPWAEWHLAPLDWMYLALLGVFCTGLAHYLFVASLEGLAARSVGLIVALEPVYAIACAWWLFGQQPGLRMLAGAALIIVAVLLPARRR